jgi:hypothetical protein
MAASLNQKLQEVILQSLDADAFITDTSKLVIHPHPVGLIYLTFPPSEKRSSRPVIL